jgi:large subunit ribosomal protein L9
MELLLLQDIDGIGKRNDIIVVGDGFALNCLLPQHKALVATPTVRKRYAEQIKRRAEERETERKVQQESADALRGKTVTIVRKVAKTGKLYAAVSAQDIVKTLKDQHGVEIAADQVEIAEHIKSIGNVTVSVKLPGGATIPLQVSVQKEQEEVKKAPAKKEA